MKTQITINISVTDRIEAQRVLQAFETMNKNFGAKGIIKLEQLFLNDPFIRNLVKMQLKRK